MECLGAFVDGPAQLLCLPPSAHPDLVDRVGLDQRSKLGSNLNNSRGFNRAC